MSINITTKLSKKSNAVLLPFCQHAVDNNIISLYSGLGFGIEFSAKAKEINSFIHPESQKKIFLIGLGEAADVAKSTTFFRSFIYHQKSKGDLNVDVILDHLSPDHIANAVIGLRLGMMTHSTFKTKEKKPNSLEINIILAKTNHNIAEKALIVAESQISTMQLVDMPSNIKTPTYIADKAIESGKKHGFDVKVFDTKKLKQMGMDALLAVGQGSCHPPVLIVMEYKPKNSKSKKPKLGLVGKGISFDTGGISIKSSTNMGYMKSDMGGAAAVIGAIELAAKLQLDIHLVGIVPSAENSVDANSIRPGDVIGSYSGKSIEVIDTDAEGRLVLADGLAYIRKHHDPEYLIDLATLTGSVIATLGYTAGGLFTQNDEMAHDLSVAGKEVHERLWRLPLWEEYLTDMQSDIADIKNLSGRPISGAITAAKFVEYFTDEHPNWAHLDIAGVAFGDSEYAKMRTATGYGVRLMVQYMQMLIAKN